MKAIVITSFFLFQVFGTAFAEEIPTESECILKIRDLRAQLIQKVGGIASTVQSEAVNRARTEGGLSRDQVDLILITGANISGRSSQLLESLVQNLNAFCRQVGESRKIIVPQK